MQYRTIPKVMPCQILLMQVRQEKGNALRLPEAEGQRKGSVSQEGCDEALRLLFVGDSTMAGVGVAHQVAALASQTAAEVSALLFRSLGWDLSAQAVFETSPSLFTPTRKEYFQY